MSTQPETSQISPEAAAMEAAQREIAVLQRERTATHQYERIDAQKEALVADESLREVMREVVAVRAAAEGREIEDLSDYTDFAGFYKAARNAFDFRTRPDGSYGERWEAEQLVW